MKNLNRQLSALAICAVFATMQVAMAVENTNLGVGLGGAEINNVTGGYAGLTTGTNSATLKFTDNSHVNWNTLNLNSNETLNFNAINDAKGLTILNTVNYGMSNLHGAINANSGINKLIISNPNGVLFDGARFSTAGDVNITTENLGSIQNPTAVTQYTNLETNPGNIIVKNIKDNNFSIGGEFNLVGQNIEVLDSAIKTGNGFKLTTLNGMDYAVTRTGTINSVVNDIFKNEKARVNMKAVNVDGDVYITSGKGAVKITEGGNINGDLTIVSDGDVGINILHNNKTLKVTGDVDAKANGIAMYARNTEFGGNLNMENGGGFLDVGDIKVEKDMNLTTTAESENHIGRLAVKHFTHVVDNTTVKGNVNIDSKHNIHVGNYDYGKMELLDGNFEVGGDLNAHAHDGHVMITIDTQADKINLKSDNYNVLSDDETVLTANDYKFSSNGYIGAIGDYTKSNGTFVTKENQIINLMENYTFIPDNLGGHAYMNVKGADPIGAVTISEVSTPTTAYIKSLGNITLNGANAKNINIVAPKSRIDITGPDVHAANINVGPETDYLKVDFPNRDYTLNYTNIKDGRVITINKSDEITYDITDGDNGNNQPTLLPGEKTTYLIGPDKPVTPDPGHDPGPDPNPPVPGPEPTPTPPPAPNPPTPDGTEPAKNLMTQWTPTDALQAPVNTPVAFAADLDEDSIDKAVRKNVDGSVTVVRAFPMIN